MPRAKSTPGRCAYCQEEFSKGAMGKHLGACPARQAVIAKAEEKAGGSGSRETLHHLRVQDADGGQFWLDLEVRGSATLKQLDGYLRAIWLECCGHLSEFSFGGWGSRKFAMSRKIDDVFGPGVELTHIYDFGTSSETLIRGVAAREGRPTTVKPIVLLARNVMPAAECIQCGAPATFLCMECLIEDDVWGTLCAEHAERHPHANYGEPIPLVNSPRLGLCGYNGPAEPPY